MRLLLQLVINGLSTGALYAMMAIGFGLVYRSTRVFHLAYGGLYVLACYFLLTAMNYLKFPLASSLALTVIGTGLTGMLVEKAVYLPFLRRNASSGALLIASLGVYVVCENLVALLFGNGVKTISTGIEPSIKLSGFVIARLQAIQFAVGSGVILVVWWALRRWTLAKALWAMGDEPELIPVVGLPVKGLRTTILAASSVMIAVPASLISLDMGMDPHVGMSYVLIAAVAVFFGGVDSFWGWVTGGFGLALLQSLVIWRFSAQWLDLAAFGLIVAVLLLRPQGLLGMRRRIEDIST